MTVENYDIVINERGGRTVKRSLDDIADSAQRGIQPLKQLNTSIGNNTSAADIFYGSLKRLGGILATLKLTSLITESATLSQRYNELGIVLDVVGRNAGLLKSEVDGTTEAVRKQGISMIESRQIVTRMIQSQIDLSKATQLARLAQDAAVIGQVNSSEALDRLVFGITSAQVEVLRGIGINVSFEQSYSRLAKEMGVTQNALTEQQKLQARLNVVLGEGAKLTGVYEGAMANAGKQMRSTERLVEDLKVKIGGLFDQTSIFAVTAYTNALKEADSSVDNFTQTGQLKAWGDSIARITAFAADSVRSVGIVFDITGKAIGAMAAQAVAISRFDFGTAFKIQGDFNKDFDAAIGSMSKMRDLVESQIVERDLLTAASDRETQSLKANTVQLTKNTDEAKKDVDVRKRFIEALQSEVDSIGLNEFAIKRMEAAKIGASKAAGPLIDALEQENKRLNLQSIHVNQITADLNKYREVTESVMTDQEKLAAKVSELDRLKGLTNGAAISQETYNRALKKANEEFSGVKKSGQDAFGSIDQYAIQAARNIQTSLANFLFDPFEDGLKGMVEGVANSVRRMIAEFAAMKIAQSTGLGDLFGFGVGAAKSGGGSSALNIASLGTNAASLFKSGFGIPSLVGRGLSMLPGSIGAFGSGLAGTAAGTFSAAGGAGTAFIGGAGTAIGGSGLGGAATFGASAAAVAGPAVIAFAADQLLRGIFGNTRLGGTAGKIVNAIPVIGPLIGGLFGHKPEKFRQEALIGNASGEGFDGRVTDVFRAKGGLLVGNKHREASSPNEAAFLDLFDTTLKGFGDSVKGFAENLGLSTDSVTNFSKEIDLRSEKGKRITEEAIRELLDSLGNELAGGVLKQIDAVAKSGETNIQTLQRLSAEFDTMNLAALATGRSLKEARDAILDLPITLRTQVIDQLGGLDAAGQKINFFIDTFVDDTTKFNVLFESLDIQMKKFGFSAAITRGEFTRLVQSVGEVNGITQDQFVGLLSLGQAYDQVDKLRTKLTSGTADLVENERSLLDIRNELTSTYQKERSEIEGTISRFKNLASQLKGFRENLLLGELSPLTPGQRLEEARTQFNQVRAKASAGDENALAELPNAAQEFLKASQTYNASSAAFISDFNLVQNVLKNAESSALSQIDILRNQLSALDDSVFNLIDINNNTKTMAELIKEINVKTLNGPGNASISTQDIQGFLAANPGLSPQQIANTATKFGVSKDQLIAAGVNPSAINSFTNGATVTDKQILDFVKSGASLKQVYDAAVSNGVTSQRLAKVTGWPITDIDSWVKQNGLPSFAKGTDFIARSGLAMVHRAEAIVPSSTTEEIKKLREEIVRLREEQNQQTGDMIAATDITNKQNAKAIAEAMAEIEKRRQWVNRSMPNVA